MGCPCAEEGNPRLIWIDHVASTSVAVGIGAFIGTFVDQLPRNKRAAAFLLLIVAGIAYLAYKGERQG